MEIKYKTAQNKIHYYWKWIKYENQKGKPKRLPVQIPVEYIKFTYPSSQRTYMPMSELLANDLAGLSFRTATEAIKIEKAS